MAGGAEDERLVLCVGLVCTDIITVTASYPQEDSDQRVLDQWWHRGGNASNSCTVLSQLGAKSEFLGTLTDDEHMGFIKSNFEAYGIKSDNCVYHQGHKTPVSIVIINNESGTRTILHSGKKLPELTRQEFEKIDISRYKWIHFEGRPNCEEMKHMLGRIDQYNDSLEDKTKTITTSVELEKQRDDLGLLENTADYVFVSKEHAQFRGCQNMTDAVNHFAKRCRQNATVICPWGEEGAMARTPDGSIHRSPIFPPTKVVDTLAAGDTFNAATIHALTKGQPVATAITFGCQVAGAKVGMKGLDGLKEWYLKYKESL